MLHIKSLDEARNVFKALGSDIRIEIVKVLLNESGLSMNELAERLNITNGALTSHIKKLEETGIVMVSSDATGHGNQKVCSVHLDKILFELQDKPQNENIYTSDIKVGHFSDFSVYPTCGLASGNRLIGEVDDNRYFAHPDRYEADILWFTRGFVEYTIPNFVPHNQVIDEICISVELSSEAPGVNNVWPSDIYFYLNETLLGTWISPGDYGDVKGIFTPDWWFPNWNQYGLLKMIVVNHKGTFIDGLKISDVNIDQFGLTPKSLIKFKLEVPENAEHVGGLTIFGKGFGNYNQDIIVKMAYSPKELII
ncbi:MAG: winged helix-turn-helix transcriptional regulator [Butyrivibrio sp.]|uniref:ArsR/SmtB family transcription factor n=1 Tax=Butyrivibrio sp. TaxID=28121 RepID=UPI0025BB8806|nr:winged helix-turn-helix transcriptional regulator [Butyrivibrio sp.]MBQ6588278.1 winged helix-turn-helix transcriptional regulator [Butyrivibrio sp.]